MLVNVHHPKVKQITTHDSSTAERVFHTVQLTEPDTDTAGRVDLFIRGDWSDWDALVEQVTQYRQTAAVRALGAEHGKSAGSWAIDGNTDAAIAQGVIDGYEAGDPAVMDACVSPLRAERFDALAPDDVYEAAGIELDETGEGPDWLLVEYENAYSDAYWAEVLRAAHVITEPVIVHTTCDDCELEVEGVEGGTEWRDRGNCTVCPNGQQAHSVDA